MAQNKKSFVLYADLLKSIEHLTNEEKGILFNHLLEYVNDLNPLLTDRLILTAWKPIELQLKRDLIKFEEVKLKRSDAGKRSAELRQLKSVEQNPTNPTLVKSVEQASTNSTDNDNDNVNVNDTVNVTDTDILLKKETKKNILPKFDFYEFLSINEAEHKLILEWAAVRKLKKLTNTQTAMEDFLKEVEKSGQNINEILKICIIKSWGGFKNKFLQNELNNDSKNTNSPQRANGSTNGIQRQTGKQSFVVTPESLYAAMQAREEN